MANIQRTVGSGRDHATIQAAIDYFNSKNFVSDGDTGEILIYNDAEWTIGSTLTGPTGVTTDSTHGLTIRAADGNSFKDHANKLTNALRYNPSNGVAIRCTSSVTLINLTINHLTLIGLQFANYVTATVSLVESPTGSARTWTVRDCIMYAKPTSGTSYGFTNIAFGTFKIINCLMYGASIYLNANGGDVIAGCTVHNPNDGSDRGGIRVDYGAARVVTNLAYSNAATNNDFRLANGGSYAANSRNNGAVDTSGPSTNLVQFVAADVYESVTTDSEDFRIKAAASSSVKTGGFRIDADNQDLDIVGSSRSTTAPTIGAWEFASAGGMSYPLSGKFGAFLRGKLG